MANSTTHGHTIDREALVSIFGQFGEISNDRLLPVANKKSFVNIVFDSVEEVKYI